METRKIELALDTAKRWYQQGGELRQMALGVYKKEELVYRIIPETWKEFCDYHGFERGECYINDYSRIVEKVEGHYRISPSNDNVLPSKESAEQHLALMKLHQLRDCYRGDWVPTFYKSDKYGIRHFYNPDTGRIELMVVRCNNSSTFLTFETFELANKFLTNFRDLIEQAGDLI